MRLPHWLAHRWGKWSAPEFADMIHGFFDGSGYVRESVKLYIQKRSCETCGQFSWRRV